MRKNIFWKTGAVLAGAILIFGGFLFFEKKHSKQVIDLNSQEAKPESVAANVAPDDSAIPSGAAPEEATAPEEKTKEKGVGMDTGVSAKTPDKSSVKAAQETPDENQDKAVDFKIINRLVGFGFQTSSGRKIDTLIVHSSYNAVGSDPYNLGDIINKEYKPNGVSPHYIIDRNGKVYRLVADENIAYHAGDSRMPDGRTGVNNFSIGVEIVTTKTGKPSDAQYAVLNDLIKYLKDKYPIKNILGHNQIAPGRKDDPWNFDWSKVAK